MINLYKDSGKLIYLLSSYMSRKKVVSASKAFVKSKKHCIVLTLSDYKSSLEGFGDESWVEALRKLQSFMKSSLKCWLLLLEMFCQGLV